MSSARWAISLFLVFHVGAIVLASLLPPDQLPDLDVARPRVDAPIAAHVAPVLDGAAAALAPVAASLWHATAPIRLVSDVYVQLTGLGQRWAMFADPPVADQYLRLRYYIADARSDAERPSRTASELVYPAANEGRIRLVQAFRDSYRDKAMAIALQRFQARIDETSAEPVPDLPDDLAPIARYFGRRFAHQRLAPHERILRTDVWYGTARNPSLGAAPAGPGERQIVLTDYYTGPIERRVTTSGYPRYHSFERESDIIWRLEYFE